MYPDPNNRLRQHMIDAAVVILACIMAFGLVVRFQFLSWDDQTYLLNNPLLESFSLGNLMGFFRFGSIPGEKLYIPISYLSFAPNAWFLGFSSAFAHIVNLLLHIANSTMVLIVLRRFCLRWPALIGALIFAIHPLQAESVAWAFGRRELLSACFSLATVLTFCLWIDHGRRATLAVSIALFALAILSKPTCILLPLILPLLLKTEQRRPRIVGAILPFFVIALVGFWLNSQTSGRSELRASAQLFRLLWLPHVTGEWLQRLLLLQRPHPFYLNEELVPEAICGIAIVLTGAILSLVYVLVRKRRWQVLAFGASAAILLAPAGSILLLANREFYTADRYAYLAMAPLAGTFVSLLYQMPWRIRHLWAIPFAFLAFFFSWRQAGLWQNTEALCRHALSRTRDNPMAWTFLGTEYLKAGNTGNAKYCYREAIRARLNHVSAWQNLLVIANQESRRNVASKLRRRLLIAKHGWAANVYLRACKMEPQAALVLMIRAQETASPITCPEFHFRLGQLQAIAGNRPAAIQAFRETVQLAPEKGVAFHNMGVLLIQEGRSDDAVECLQTALLRVSVAEGVDTRLQLGIALLQSNRLDEGVGVLESVVELRPKDGQLHRILATAYLDLGKMDKARSHAELSQANGVALEGRLGTLVEE